MYDVIVSGAGPSGSYLSYLLSKNGYKVLQLEEHKEIGKPVECTGLVSERVFKYVKSNSIVNEVHGANVFFPNGKSIHIAKGDKTIVMYRDDFDKDVSAMAIGAGSDTRINSRVLDAKVNDSFGEVKYRENGKIKYERASVIVGADGATSRIRSSLNYERPQKLISTYQVDSSFKLEDQDDVNVFIGSENSKGFFGWAVPSGEITRIGVGVDHVTAIKYFKNINAKFNRSQVLGINSGPIPIKHLKKTYGNRSMLLGDAAGIVKPLSGGGIYTGIISAKNAYTAIDRAFKKADFSEKTMKEYQKLWKHEIGKELYIDSKIQKYFSNISTNDELLNKMYNAINTEYIIKRINSLGDIDYPAKVVFSILIRKPQLIKYFLFGG
ncbi:geranylgeranyl reductase family protein [Ferroplasma sp.]|uniref:geranylgeranyl reductase family protein n=1 Tax=Ferroplasma sp. TaxID=2591003 RepID=UPI00307EE0C3